MITLITFMVWLAVAKGIIIPWWLWLMLGLEFTIKIAKELNS